MSEHDLTRRLPKIAPHDACIVPQKRSLFYGGRTSIPEHLLADLRDEICDLLAEQHPGTVWLPVLPGDPPDQLGRGPDRGVAAQHDRDPILDRRTPTNGRGHDGGFEHPGER
jgi:hypothetical protein